MKRGVRAGLAALPLVAIALAALAWWRLDAQARPEAVTSRLIEGVVARFPGASVRSVSPAIVEALLSSGAYVDMRVDTLRETCAARRTACSTAIDGALHDVERAEAAARSPTRDALRPVLVGDASGYRYGFRTEPFFATLETRYVLAAGLAATFVTGTIADRLGLTGTALHDAALAGLIREAAPALDRLPGPGPALYRVRSSADPVAVLLVRARLAEFAQQLATRKLVCFVPSRGIMYIAASDDATAAALDALRPTLDGQQSIGLAPFTVDLDAPADAALAMVRRVR